MLLRRDAVVVRALDRDKKITAVTAISSTAIAPVFDAEGKFVYFQSDRDYNEVLGNYDFESANSKTTPPYLVQIAVSTLLPIGNPVTALLRTRSNVDTSLSICVT